MLTHLTAQDFLNSMSLVMLSPSRVPRAYQQEVEYLAKYVV